MMLVTMVSSTAVSVYHMVSGHSPHSSSHWSCASASRKKQSLLKNIWSRNICVAGEGGAGDHNCNDDIRRTDLTMIDDTLGDMIDCLETAAPAALQSTMRTSAIKVSIG